MHLSTFILNLVFKFGFGLMFIKLTVLNNQYSSLNHVWLLTLMGEPSMQTTEWRKEANLIPSFPPIKHLVSDSLQSSNSHISETQNADNTYTAALTYTHSTLTTPIQLLSPILTQH
jgi:hypothetical protein